MASTASPSPAPAAPARKPKRKRVSRACDQCFLKKDRCDGLQPTCSFCAQLGRTCTYDRPERKRGPTQGLRPKLEQKIAALESVLGFVLSQTGEGAVRVDDFTRASEKEKEKWRSKGWLKSGIRKQLESELGLKDEPDAASSSATKPSPAGAGVSSSAKSSKHDDSDSDYSDVDLALPPTHQPPAATSSNIHPSLQQHNNSTSDQRDTHSDTDTESSSDHHFSLPLLSSGKGGSSLNRGLVPRGADPNAALGGFEIEFGGNQTDEDWVRSFVPPQAQQSRRVQAETSDDRHSRELNGDGAVRRS